MASERSKRRFEIFQSLILDPFRKLLILWKKNQQILWLLERKENGSVSVNVFLDPSPNATGLDTVKLFQELVFDQNVYFAFLSLFMGKTVIYMSLLGKKMSILSQNRRRDFSNKIQVFILDVEFCKIPSVFVPREKREEREKLLDWRACFQNVNFYKFSDFGTWFYLYSCISHVA